MSSARAGLAAIVAIGDEVTEGRIENGNARWLGRLLHGAGMRVTLAQAVPDDDGAMLRALRNAAEVAELVVVTGGLGPTVDDRTRDAAAALLETQLEVDPPSIERMEAMFRSLGRPMHETNRRQALFPRGAEVLPNDHGTAPGFALTYAGARLLFLPGVPREMHAMAERFVTPLAAAARGSALTRQARLCAFGVPEAKLDALVVTALAGHEVRYSINASEGVLKLFLTATAPTEPEVAARLAAAQKAVVAASEGHIYSELGEELEEALLRRAKERGLSVGFAESCTGGLACTLTARVPGASDVLRGAVVAYANDVKEQRLGVSAALIAAHGAVSGEVALAMAEGGCAALQVDLCAAITGIAGPTGGTPEKPVGTVFVAAAGRVGERTIREVRALRLRGDRRLIQELSARSALHLLLRALD